DDFVFTISDDEDESVPDLDDDESDSEANASEEETPVAEIKAPSKRAKKAKKIEKQIEDSEKPSDINPDFEFSLDGFEASTGFSGWDFEPISKEETNVKRDVELDAMIERRITVNEFSKADEEEEEEENDDDEDNEEEIPDEVEADEEEADEEESEDDEDDLAMDGFGMGADGASDIENDEEEVAEGEETGPKEEGSEDEDDDEEDKNAVKEDTAEEIAKFYAPAAETDIAKDTVHKTFQTFSLSRPVLRGISALGYSAPTPIQSATIPISLLGKDIVAGAVTGSGKTAAYLIPIIERLLYRPKKIASTRVVVLTPTRELAIQVGDVGRKLSQYVSGLRFGLAVGGLNLRIQEQELKTRPDIVVATPGRFIDHIRNSASFSVEDVEILVIDEADRMLEEGFQKELTEILSLIPSKRQTLLFSATMNNSIKDLIQLSLSKPVRIMINPPKQTAGGLTQEFIRIRKRESFRPALLVTLLKKLDLQQRMIIFVARKETAHKLRIILGLLGLKIGELHGGLTQEQRLKSVTAFRNLDVPLLICTDLAARGLDIPKIEVVINYDMPKSFEIYLHRVGRTARAGRDGRAISFVGEHSSDRAIVKESIKSVEEGKVGKALGRNVDWNEVDVIKKTIDSKATVIEEVLAEEKEEKAIVQAEMELRKGENLIKYSAEIKARPRRTWFEDEKDKKSDTQLKKDSNKRRTAKKQDDDEEGRSYKKTRKDRTADQEKSLNKRPGSGSGKGKGSKK
ncbi:DEAD-domain-containing protein, partial [Nadsonia fulvescens var. elongata DSM 6958]